MQWFESWFDSPYYPILYNHRNIQEAESFIDNLINFLPIKKQDLCLDLACGRGRHAKYLSEKGMKVVGIDLSHTSIEEAIENFAHAELQFHKGDMRHFDLDTTFHFIFNLFTSFGYFDVEDDNLLMLKQVHKHLDSDGIFVLDYLNPNHIDVRNSNETIVVKNDIVFKTRKKIIDDRIVKDIEIQDGTTTLHYEEKVQLFNLSWFQENFKKLNFELIHLFGDYDLSSYHETDSKRMIFITKKIVI